MAGLENTLNAGSPDAAAYTVHSWLWETVSRAAMPARLRSAVTMTWLRDSRSAAAPAASPSSSTGAISKATAPPTFSPVPVSR